MTEQMTAQMPIMMTVAMTNWTRGPIICLKLYPPSALQWLTHRGKVNIATAGSEPRNCRFCYLINFYSELWHRIHIQCPDVNALWLTGGISNFSGAAIVMADVTFPYQSLSENKIKGELTNNFLMISALWVNTLTSLTCRSVNLC